MLKWMKKLCVGVTVLAMLLSSTIVGQSRTYAVDGGELNFDFSLQSVGEAPTGIRTVNGDVKVAELESEKCMKVTAYATTSNQSSNAYFIVENTTTGSVTSTNGELIASASYYFPEALTNQRYITDYMYYKNAQLSTRSFVPYNFYNDKLYSSSTQTEELMAYPVGKWFTLKFTLLQGQAGKNDSSCSLDIIVDGITENVYSGMSLTSLGAESDTFTSIYLWQHNFITQYTVDTENPENNSPCYYIDNLKIERIVQTDGLDVNFDDEYYTAGKSPSRVGIYNVTNGLNTTVQYWDENYKNVLKCQGVSGEIRNSYNLKNIINKDACSAWVFEYDQYCMNAISTGEFPIFMLGDISATKNNSANIFSPYAMKGTTFYSNYNNIAGTSLGKTFPLNEWFKVRFTYIYTGSPMNDVIKLEMVNKDNVTTELYNLKRSEASLWFNGTNFPYGSGTNIGVGTLSFTLADTGTQYFDNIKMYTMELPRVSNFTVKNVLKLGEVLTADYNFETPDEGTDASTIKWYRGSAVTDGVNTVKTEIGTGKTYTLTADDLGKYITCEVTPISSTGFSGAAISSFTVTVPEISYNIQSVSDLLKFKTTVTNASMTVEEFGGRNAIKILGNGTAVGGANFQNNVTYGGLNEGNILYSIDLYMSEAFPDGNNALLQPMTTTGNSESGKYVNAFWIKGDKLYDTNGSTELCTLPIGEWFTIKTIISAEAYPYMTVVVEKGDGTAIVANKKNISLSSADTNGITFVRFSYSSPIGATIPLYVSNIKITNDYPNGIQSLDANQVGDNVECTANVIDYTYSGGKLIIAGISGNKLSALEIKDLDASKAVNEIVATLNYTALSNNQIKAFVWSDMNTIKPLFNVYER